MKIGYVYEIVCKDKSITKVYIGSTWDMNNRKIKHKYCCYNKNRIEYNYPLYCFIRENGGWDNWEMNQIVWDMCLDRTELHRQEQFYIDLYGGIENLLNCCDAIMNKEKSKEKNNIYNNKLRQRNIESKRFYCEPCDSSFQSIAHLNRHLKSTNHYNKVNNILPLPTKCIGCNHTFQSNYALQIHLNSNKHINNIRT